MAIRQVNGVWARDDSGEPGQTNDLVSQLQRLLQAKLSGDDLSTAQQLLSSILEDQADPAVDTSNVLEGMAGDQSWPPVNRFTSAAVDDIKSRFPNFALREV